MSINHYLKYLPKIIILCFFGLFAKGQCNPLELTGEFPQTINGILVSVSYSGSNAQPLSTAGQAGNCVGTYTSPEVPWLGNSSTPTAIILSFSSPINNVVVAAVFNGIIGDLSEFDNLVFSTNAGVPTLTGLPGLCSGGTIVGPNYSANITNTAEFLQVSAPGNYDTLTITQFEDKTSNGGSGIMVCSTSITVVPVSLVSFNAFKAENTTILHWQTTREINSSYFAIERSVNNTGNWQTIGNVPANGNSSNVSNYRFTDTKPSFTATCFYRLRCVDVDNKFTFSEIRNIKFNPTDKLIQVYPNPVQDELTVTGETSGSMLQLTNIFGQAYESKIATGFDKINTRNLAKGIYILKIIAKDGSVSPYRISKN